MKSNNVYNKGLGCKMAVVEALKQGAASTRRLRGCSKDAQKKWDEREAQAKGKLGRIYSKSA
jgi:hypothetical protein